MKQGLFESDKAFAERVKRESAAKMGINQGIFESDASFERRVQDAVGKRLGVNQGLFESDSNFQKRMETAYAEKLGVKQGLFESDASFQKRTETAYAEKLGLKQGLFESDANFQKRIQTESAKKLGQSTTPPNSNNLSSAFKPPINSNEAKSIGGCYFILLLILSPIALVYLSVTEQDFGIPVFCSVMIGTILSYVFFLKEKKYKTIFLNIWLLSSCVLFIFYLYDSVSRSGFRLGSAIGILLGSAFFVSVHSAIFAGLVYLIFPKINLNNIANPANKIIRITLLLLIPFLIYLIISQYKQYIREEAEWYDDDIPINQELSEEYSNNGKQDFLPTSIANNSTSLSYQSFPTIPVNYPTSSTFDYSPTYIPNVYPISENIEIPTPNYSFRFTVGDRGYICAPGGVNLRKEPNIDNENRIKTLPSQSKFTIIGGPKIDNSTIWWQVNVDNEGIGWMSEGHDAWNSDFLLCVLN